MYTHPYRWHTMHHLCLASSGGGELCTMLVSMGFGSCVCKSSPHRFQVEIQIHKDSHRWNGNKYNYNLACVTSTQKSSNIFCDQPNTVKSNAPSSHLDGLLRMALENRRELAQLAPLVVCQRYLYTYIHIYIYTYMYMYIYICIHVHQKETSQYTSPMV